MENLTKQEYLEVRKELRNGVFKEKGWQLMYQYFNEVKGEYKNMSIEEFVANLNLYFTINHYHTAVNRVLEYFDRKYVVTKIIKIKDNSVLLEY